MANIQAALNNMLSAAQTGAFIYTQTPEYKKRGEIKELQKQRKIQEMESEDIESIINDETASQNKLYAAAEREKELSAEEYSTMKDLYKLTGDKALYEDMLKRVPSKQGELGKELREQAELEKAAKEEARLAALNEKIETQRRQQASMKWREDFLRAGRDTIPTNYSTKEENK